MIINILLVIIVFAGLILGAKWIVDGASVLVKKYCVSDLAIVQTIKSRQ